MDVTATILLVVRQELCIASCQQPIRNRSDEKVPDRGTNDQPCGAHYHFDKAILLVAEGLIEFGGVQVSPMGDHESQHRAGPAGAWGTLVARPLHCIGDACSLKTSVPLDRDPGCWFPPLRRRFPAAPPLRQTLASCPRSRPLDIASCAFGVDEHPLCTRASPNSGWRARSNPWALILP